jgi:eukaryotic-like serine/threonine-protein kinase
VLHDVGTYLIEVVDDPTIPNAPDVAYTLSFGLMPPPVVPGPEPTPLPAPTPAPAPSAPSLVSVPGVVGQSPNSASRLLHDAGLVVEVSTADAFSVSGLGTVATQNPQPAARVAPGSTVRLGIASGRVVIPSVRGRTESEAYTILRAAGFTIQTRRRADDVVPSGSAIGTNPGDGAILSSGSSIELLISQGH